MKKIGEVCKIGDFVKGTVVAVDRKLKRITIRRIEEEGEEKREEEEEEEEGKDGKGKKGKAKGGGGVEVGGKGSHEKLCGKEEAPPQEDNNVNFKVLTVKELKGKDVSGMSKDELKRHNKLLRRAERREANN